MNQTRTSMTPPWIPVGLSTLVLLGLVVVLSLNPSPPQRTSAITTTSMASSTSVPASQLVTKILWRTPTTVAQRPSEQSNGSGNYTDTFPTVTLGNPASGTVLEAPYDLTGIAVLSRQHIRVTMTPHGMLNLRCGDTGTPVDFDFIVPSTPSSCLLEITGIPGTTWTVEVMA